MKKIILIVALVVAVVAIGAFGIGAVYAQGGTTSFIGYGPMMQNGTSGVLHTFMVKEFAKKLNLNVNDVNKRIAGGETMYDIALSAGVAADKFPALMTEVRTNSLDAAVKANVITQAQADFMKTRGVGFDGDCPMLDGDNQTSFRGGYGGMMGNGQVRGGMMGGWGTQQVKP